MGVACLAWASPPASATPEPRQFTLSAAGCNEVQVGVSVPRANVDDEVPDRFAPAENPPGSGLVTLAIGTRRCDTISIDGHPARPNVRIAEVGVIIEPPAGAGPGQHFYQLWELTSDPPLAAKLHHVGMAGDLVTSLSLATSLVGGEVAAPWSESPYSYDVTAPGADGVDFQGATFTWWHDGSHGEMTTTYTFPPEKVRLGAGVVTAKAGSPLARLLGGTKATALGAVIRLPGFAAVHSTT